MVGGVGGTGTRGVELEHVCDAAKGAGQAQAYAARRGLGDGREGKLKPRNKDDGEPVYRRDRQRARNIRRQQKPGMRGRTSYEAKPGWRGGAAEWGKRARKGGGGEKGRGMAGGKSDERAAGPSPAVNEAKRKVTDLGDARLNRHARAHHLEGRLPASPHL